MLMPLVADGISLNFIWLMLLPLGFLWLMLLPKLCDVADVIAIRVEVWQIKANVADVMATGLYLF